MDKKTVELLLGKFPSEVVKLVVRSNEYFRPFLFTGIVEQVTDSAIIFTTKQRKSAIAFEEILQIVPMGRKEL